MLSKSSVAPDPVKTLQQWAGDARDAGLGSEPRVTLATADRDGMPDARIVIVRQIDDEGLTFYTDARSPKAEQIASRPQAAIVIYWPSLGRQLRVRGTVTALPAAECDAAFAARPRHFRLGFWTAPESEVVADRDTLVSQAHEAAGAFAGRDVPRPEHWVIYRLQPEYLEFWQSDDANLHDRIACTRTGERWWVERLQP